MRPFYPGRRFRRAIWALCAPGEAWRPLLAVCAKDMLTGIALQAGLAAGCCDRASDAKKLSVTAFWKLVLVNESTEVAVSIATVARLDVPVTA